MTRESPSLSHIEIARACRQVPVFFTSSKRDLHQEGHAKGRVATGSRSKNCLRTTSVAKKLANDPSVTAASRYPHLQSA